jgi:predicted AlkP superfamily phosphohydrolase/phosphomutase/tetratricopeptide (TPR) repeat protein
VNSPARKRRVLLVGWDAADWKVISPLVDEGLMPHTARLVEGGVMGNLATIQPVLSPMLWTSIATGKRAYKHGIHGFSEPDPKSGAIRPITNLSRSTKAVWNILHQQGLKSHVVGWWPSHPAEPIRGSMVSNRYHQAPGSLNKPWPLRPGTVFPPELAKELRDLRVHPHELEGEMLLPFVPDAPQIDQAKDKRLTVVAKTVAECSSIHAAATHLLHTQRDWDFAAIYYDAIDHFGHAFMKYHPPRLPWVSEADFERYKNVVRMGYQFHDAMLGALLHLAGPDTTVILMSDHGFHSDHLRPRVVPNEPAGPAAEHRPFGIFVANGPGLRRDDVMFGASILDVAPTVLNLFGLPVGRDMDGRVLTTLFEAPPKVEYVDSWDDVEGDAGRHPPETQIDPGEAQAAIRQLVELGYIDEPDADKEKAVAQCVRELHYNLARAQMDGGRMDDAAALFSDLWEKWPEESRFGVHLLQTHLARQQPVEARAVMTRLRERKAAAARGARDEYKKSVEELKAKQAEARAASGDAVPTKPVDAQGLDMSKLDERTLRRLRQLRSRSRVNREAFLYLEGSLLSLEGRWDEAAVVLSQGAASRTSNQAARLVTLGEVHLKRRDTAAAERSFQQALEIDPLGPQARFGLARVAMRQRDPARAADEALAGLGRRFFNPEAHWLAGIALWRCGRVDEAEASLLRAVEQQPVFPGAHRTLASFFQRERRDTAAFLKHRWLASEARKRVRAWRAGVRPEAVQHAEERRETFGEWGGATDTVGAPALPPREECVVIVTGLPRTGTSMMMQMLQAGGIPVLADEHRPADENNQRGYLEFEPAKKLARDAAWLADAKGSAVKLVAQLVPSLPRDHRYRIIMMHRPLAEVASSQRRMLERLGRDGTKLTDAALTKVFHKQVMQVRTLLRHLGRQGVVSVLDVKYHDALTDPRAVAERLSGFLGEDFNVSAAAAAVDPALRRERAEPGPTPGLPDGEVAPKLGS